MMYTLEDFLAGKVVIIVDDEDREAFYNLCAHVNPEQPWRRSIIKEAAHNYYLMYKGYLCQNGREDTFGPKINFKELLVDGSALVDSVVEEALSISLDEDQ